MPVCEVTTPQFTAEEKKLMRQRQKEFDQRHPEPNFDVVNTAGRWQDCYLIWGPVSLKFRYPVLHGPLTPYERQERKIKNKNRRFEERAESVRFHCRLDAGLRSNCEEALRIGSAINQSTIDFLKTPYDGRYKGHVLIDNSDYLNRNLAERIEREHTNIRIMPGHERAD